MAIRDQTWAPHALLGAARTRPAFRATAALHKTAASFATSAVPELELPPAAGSAAATPAPHRVATGEEAMAPAAASPAVPAPPRNPAPAIAPERIDLQALLEQRYAEGHAEGLRQARTSLDPTKASATGQGAAAALLQRVMDQLDALSDSPERHFEPLKRLALHLAHQLVQVELTLSARAIDGLIRRCTQALGEEHGEVVIELHPDDLALLEPLAPEGLPGKSFRADPALGRGSVRVHGEHADVEDLIEKRLGLLARELKIDETRWRSGLDAVATAAAAAAAVNAEAEAVLAVPATALSPDRSPRLSADDLLQDAQDIAFRMTDDPPDPEPNPDRRA